MAPTAIIKCPNCAGLFLSGSMQKTKLCPYCGKKVNLQKAHRLAQAASAMEASEVLKQLKIQNGKSVDSDFRCV
ncbi:MAG: DUF1922 domain-containing protein [Nitrososphaerota archaeon]|nr:DUF1922 domain-containing protein [Nitrososphaerota archaeon]